MKIAIIITLLGVTIAIVGVMTSIFFDRTDTTENIIKFGIGLGFIGWLGIFFCLKEVLRY